MNVHLEAVRFLVKILQHMSQNIWKVINDDSTETNDLAKHSRTKSHKMKLQKTDDNLFKGCFEQAAIWFKWSWVSHLFLSAGGNITEILAQTLMKFLNFSSCQKKWKIGNPPSYLTTSRRQRFSQSDLAI